MKLTMLGTGNALVTKIYNTCFVLEDNHQYFMVDAGGGNQILTQLKNAGYDWKNMKHIFLTHKHIDHLLGMVWMMRMITQFMNAGKYEGDAYIYGHDEVIHILKDMADTLLVPKQSALIGKRLHLVEVKDQETKEIMGHPVTFFDIHSTKAKQFGFMVEYDGKKLTCCGDEPYCEEEKVYAENADVLLHEAFCLYEERDFRHPYEKHHSTVKDACELAQKLHIKNLVLYHTEDDHVDNRKELYKAEGAHYYTGNIFVPDDLEVMEF